MSNQMKTENHCLDAETLAAFVENRLEVNEAAEVAGHVMICAKCETVAKDLAHLVALRMNADDANDSGEARELVLLGIREAKRKMRDDAWSRLLERFQPVSELRAAADGQSADQLLQQTAHKAGGSVYFYSHGLKNDKDPNAWCVELIVPPHPTEDCELQFFVKGTKDNEEISEGVLTLGKVPLEIKDGFAHMPLKKFIENIREPLISVRRISSDEDSGVDVPGTLVFA